MIDPPIEILEDEPDYLRFARTPRTRRFARGVRWNDNDFPGLEVNQRADDHGIASVLQVLKEIKKWQLKAELEKIGAIGNYERELIDEYMKFLEKCVFTVKQSFNLKIKTQKSVLSSLVEEQ